MDRVRFGRALGKGARLAARTAVEAAQAAAAPAAEETRPHIAASRPTASPQILRPVRSAASARRPPDVSQIGPAVKAAGAGVLGPLRGASRALWHEFTGSFFALFALSFLLGCWRTRAGALSPVPSDRHHFYEFCGLALLFGYFSVSSFLRARSKPSR